MNRSRSPDSVTVRFHNTIFLSLLAAVLAACAAPASRENMGISATDRVMYSADRALSQEISVGSVTGGKETNPMWTSEISSTDFAAALRDSLETARLLSTRAIAGYVLDADLIEVKQPFAGFSMTVHTTVQYTLRDASNREIAIQQTITADGTASTGDAFAGVKRLRIATERAAQENIKKIITILYNHGG